MTDSSHRKNIESILQSSICKAQSSVESNPEIKKMVEQLRNLYADDREDFLFSVGAAPPPPKFQKRLQTPPPSRIPQLLYILNAVTSKGPVTLPPSFRNRQGILPSSLQNAALEVPGRNEEIPRRHVPPSPTRRPPQPQDFEEIKHLDSQLDEARCLFAEIKKQESAIQQRKGKYGIPMERLKAERLLRELPATITQLEYKKRQIEEKALREDVESEDAL